MKLGIISNVIARNKTKKAILERAFYEVGHFRTPIIQKTMKNIPSFVGPMGVADAYILSSLVHPGDVAQNIFVGTLLASSYIFRNVAIQSHKEAVDGAAKLGLQLIEKGFSSSERKIVIKDKLSSGNLIFSSLFKLIYPKRVEKLADGISTKTGFIYI